MNEKSRTYDAIVIGGGPGGLVTAAGLAGLGADVAVIEKHEQMGGDCLNWGCVPSKALISSARLASQMKKAEEWGLPDIDFVVDIEQVFERVRAVRAKIAPHDSPERFEEMGVEVHVGAAAQIISPTEVKLGHAIFKTKNIVVATGAAPMLPPIDGLESVPHYTNETLFDEFDPSHRKIVVLGGGPIGTEMAQALARLGIEIVQIERSPQILSREDPDAAAVVQASMERDGVDVRTGFTAEKFEPGEFGGVIVHVGDESGKKERIDADAVLVALGRRPNVKDLGLEDAGVKFSEKGIEVDDHLRTNVKSIWAIGDVLGGAQFTHYADAQARTVIRNILFPLKKQSFEPEVVPWCTFTAPELARFGLNEKDAEKKGVEVDVYKFDLAELDRPICEGAPEGFIKVLTEKGSDWILGATVVGEGAGDWIHEYILAAHSGVGLSKIASMIHIYPTFAEACRRPGDMYTRGKLTPRVEKFLDWRWSL